MLWRSICKCATRCRFIHRCMLMLVGCAASRVWLTCGFVQQETWRKLHGIITSVTTQRYCPSILGLHIQHIICICLVAWLCVLSFFGILFGSLRIILNPSTHLSKCPHTHTLTIVDSVYQKFASMLHTFANRAAQQAQAANEQQQWDHATLSLGSASRLRRRLGVHVCIVSWRTICGKTVGLDPNFLFRG